MRDRSGLGGRFPFGIGTRRIKMHAHAQEARSAESSNHGRQRTSTVRLEEIIPI